MKTIHFPLGCAVIGALILLQPTGTGQEPAKDKKVELVRVKTKDLIDTHIAAHKGKVVAIYVWASWNVPSWQEFDNFAKLHQKYADKGLVYMTADLGRGDNENVRKGSLKFLQRKKANFANYYLEDGLEEEARRPWRIGLTPPMVVVYGRDGNLAKIYKNAGASLSSRTSKSS
jgi:hypothetical protein